MNKCKYCYYYSKDKCRSKGVGASYFSVKMGKDAHGEMYNCARFVRECGSDDDLDNA